jgi:hypothetical protein
MRGMARYNQIRFHETAWATYAKINGIHARKRFQIRPVCRIESV